LLGGGSRGYVRIIIITASSAPSDSTVSENARIEPRTVATKALEVRRYRSHPQIQLDRIHTRLDLIHTQLDFIHTCLDVIRIRMDVIHTCSQPHSARFHPY
jgi:hypothetical protein